VGRDPSSYYKFEVWGDDFFFFVFEAIIGHNFFYDSSPWDKNF